MQPKAFAKEFVVQAPSKQGFTNSIYAIMEKDHRDGQGIDSGFDFSIDSGFDFSIDSGFDFSLFSIVFCRVFFLICFFSKINILELIFLLKMYQFGKY